MGLQTCETAHVLPPYFSKPAFLSVPLLYPRRHAIRQRTACQKVHARLEEFGTGLGELRVGSVVVPRHLWDRRMRQKGVYRSVEYVIENLTLDGEPVLSTRRVNPNRVKDIAVRLRPVNRLLPRFERNWPVEVTIGDAKLFSYTADLLSCILATLCLAGTVLGVGAFGPRFVSIYSIPSASMYPTLRVGDALLVEKISLRSSPPRKGEIVLFRPPARLQRIIHAAHQDDQQMSAAKSLLGQRSTAWLKRNDLFVKRVVAVPGDVIEVREKKVIVNGRVVDKAAPGSPNVAPRSIPEGYLFVVGDNAEKSLDSRYWGLLPVDYVVGRPLARIFPLDRLDIGV